jgi:tuberculosinol/isotuberculosinol synthase
VDLETFRNLRTEEVVSLVQADGPKVAVFPINGTRRWFILEHPTEAGLDFLEGYLRIGGRRLIEVFTMLFEHGIDTVLAPIFGPDILERGDEYMRISVQGLLWFAQSQDFLTFYDEREVRVRVYGDAAKYLQGTPCAPALEAFDGLSRRTASHERHRLFFGVCAHDATESVAEISVQFHHKYGTLPKRRQIIEAYYGEYVEPVDLFIGFDRPAAFDMPLVATGREDLYFTVSPSLYMDASTLRAILYDHLYARQLDDSSYAELSPGDWETLSDFYALNRRSVIGLGRQYGDGHFWYPLPQVKLPPQMVDDPEKR